MFAITNVKTFKDSVHGYIEVPKCFVETLMDNVYFQRLRNVEQTGMRVLYPSAKHDRFSHSLGVFHLGNRAVDALLDNFAKDQYWNIESDNQSILYWAKNKVLFLIACLLHDIGHAPFSHSLESQLLHNSKPPLVKGKRKPSSPLEAGCYVSSELEQIIFNSENNYMKLKYSETDASVKVNVSKAAAHEQIGALLIFSDFFKKQIIQIFDALHNDNYPRPEGESILYSEYYHDEIVLDKIDINSEKSRTIFEDDLCFIARMIMGIKYEDWRPERQIRNCFIELLNGQNFDVDKLDYIVRDTQMSGINNISLDVDRLVSSLCIVTKTKHLNKFQLENKSLAQMTIVHIKNSNPHNVLEIDGTFHTTLIINKGAEVFVSEKSKIESFTNVHNNECKIHYKDARRAEFDAESIITQDSEMLQKVESGSGDKMIVQLLGKDGKKTFSASIKNARVLKDFYFIADEDLRLIIHEKCRLKISGLFHSEGPTRLFKLNNLRGDISEVEVLADTFKHDFTKTKVPGKEGFNTFAIGFKKQAINVIANVMDARNYLYLWIYAHHKVIYYANFLIPVLVKELLPSGTCGAFPNWSLEFENIEHLDDAYIWTVIRNQIHSKVWKKNEKNNEIKILVKELFTRKYKKSLYKSLAEYDLFFEKYDQTTLCKLQEYINTTLISTTENAKPYIETNSQGRKKVHVGYFKNSQIKIINEKICEIIKQFYSYDSDASLEFEKLKLTELVYVSVEYKRKQLETLQTFIDMNGDIVPIKQIPLLESQAIKNNIELTNNYFYLYYQTNSSEIKSDCEEYIIKMAMSKYFESVIEDRNTV